MKCVSNHSSFTGTQKESHHLTTYGKKSFSAYFIMFQNFKHCDIYIYTFERHFKILIIKYGMQSNHSSYTGTLKIIQWHYSLWTAFAVMCFTVSYAFLTFFPYYLLSINSIDHIQDCEKHPNCIILYCWKSLKVNFQLCSGFTNWTTFWIVCVILLIKQKKFLARNYNQPVFKMC